MSCLENSTFSESSCGSYSAVHPVCLLSSIEEDGNISVYSCFSDSYQGHVSVIMERPINVYQTFFSNPLKDGGGNAPQEIAERPLMQIELNAGNKRFRENVSN